MGGTRRSVPFFKRSLRNHEECSFRPVDSERPDQRPASLSAAGCGATQPDAKDAAAVSPDFYKVLIDNDQIRILDVNLPAGAKEPAHSHLWPAIIIEDTQRPGEIPAVRNFKSRWEPAQAKAKGGNPGKDPYHALRIELKKGDCEPVKDPPLPPTDGVVIHDPKILVPFENAYVRVLEIEVKPGEAEPPHTHTWPSVVYYYRLPSSRRGTADGKLSGRSPRADGPAGDVRESSRRPCTPF